MSYYNTVFSRSGERELGKPYCIAPAFLLAWNDTFIGHVRYGISNHSYPDPKVVLRDLVYTGFEPSLKMP